MAEKESLKVVVVGGAAMVLGYDERAATKDVDGFFVEPPERAKTRKWIQTVASERGWRDDWFNDAAKGFMVGISFGRILFSATAL